MESENQSELDLKLIIKYLDQGYLIQMNLLIVNQLIFKLDIL